MQAAAGARGRNPGVVELLSRAPFLSAGGTLGALMRTLDWSASPLGAPEQWPASLRTAVGLMLPARAQIVLFWGPDYIALYNDAYAPTIGDKHPRALGRPAVESWTELWDDLEPLLRSVRETGETVSARDRPFYIERHGYGEDVFFDISYSAVPDDAGGVGGVLCIVSETTERVAAEQRQAILLRLSDALRPVDSALEAQRLAAHLLGDTLKLDRCGYGEIDSKGETITISNDYRSPGTTSFVGTHRLADFGSGIVEPLRLGEIIVVDDVANHPALVDPGVARSFAAAAIGATIGVPLIKQGRLVAVLFAHQREPRRWNTRDVALVAEVAERTWEATERVRIEAAHREAERELDLTTSALPVLVSHIGPDQRYRFVNRTYQEWFGHSLEWIRGRHMREVLGDAAYAQLQPAIARALTGERFGFDSRVPYRDGGTRDVHIEYVPRFGSDGRPDGWYAHVQDIGDRLRTEEQLRESEARFRNMADHAPVMIWVTDPDGSCIYLNQAWYDFTGQSPEQAEGHGWLDATHPDDKLEAERVFLAANADRTPFRLEYRLRRHDGAFRWAIDAASPRFASDGAFLGYIGSVIDIDDRHEAEQALQISEERLRLATDAAEIGFWDVDVVQDRLIWPRQLKRMFGIASDRDVTMDDFYAGLHPEDRDATAEAFARACDPAERALYDVDYRTVGLDDGIVRWVAAKGRGLFDSSGRCIRVVGTAIDITARKAADGALRESESRLRFLGDLDASLRDSLDPAQAMTTATRLLADRLGVTRCAYADVDDDNDRFFIRADYSAPGVASSVGEYSLDLFGPRAAADMRSGRTLIVRDVPGELAPGEGREMFQSIGIDAIICCPLAKDGRLRAMMAVHNTGRRDWRADEIALVETVVERCWAQIERIGAQARLRESEERYRTLFSSIESGFCVVEVDLESANGRVDYRVVEANPAFYRQTGFPETIRNAWLRGAAPDLEEHWFDIYGRVARTGEPERFEEGSPSLGRWLDVYAFRVGRAEERRVAILFNDISARRNAEEGLRELNDTLESRVVERTAELEAAHEQLRQSQKMEAMGALTGGVAHDFNNLLTPIVGALDLLQRKELGGPREQRLIAGAAHSADRAKTLVQRLLAFARRQPLQMVPVEVAELVRGMADLIGSTTGPQIKVTVAVDDGLPFAKADPNQLEMALLNLAVNARDAMPDGGTLRISAVAAQARPGEIPGLPAGDYVRLSVADTGTGMSEDTLARAIEPFFSTKGIGRGTGLGLSMVHGLASQLGGALHITSKLGLGTNIELWLPRTDGAPAEPAPIIPEADAGERRGAVLLVDDEELVRLSTADMLEDLGYRVIEADSSEAAMAIIERGEPFDLLVTDHLMPGMTGSELARHVRTLRGDLPVLVVSGYAESEGLAPDLPRLTKPFRKDDLAASLVGVIGPS